MTGKDAVWRENYEALRRYVLERGHLPDKHVVENRALLNWAKYNRKKAKPVRSRLTRCSSLRSFWHYAAMNTPAAASRKNTSYNAT
ncbi:MAG: helicase associated domain-containing protein [Segatella copri]